MPEAELEACYELIDQTSGDDYRSLSVGWHPEAKRKEMRSPGLRYVLVKRKKGNDKNDTEEEKTENGGEGEIRAFTSLMPTFEDGQPVIYCYEIHLKPDMERYVAQVLERCREKKTEEKKKKTVVANIRFPCRTGLGKLLMGHVTAAADRIPTLEKTMLTCFVRNAHARGFYERLGFAEDESSPRPRRLRGKVVEPEYIIMARRTDKERGGQVADGEQESKRAKTAP